MLVALTFALAACGGSSGEDAASRTTSEATTTTTTTVVNRDDPFCQKVAEAAATFGLSVSGANLGALLQQLPQAAILLEEARAVAPAEVAADVGVLAATLQELSPLLNRIASLSTASKTDPSKAAELQSATVELMGKLSSIQSPAFTTAVANLNAYSKAHCGVSFG